MNLCGLYFAGSQIESRLGTAAFGLLVLFTAITSNLGQVMLSKAGGTIEAINFGGISGVVFGLFGYLWLRQRIQPQAGFLASTETMVIFVVMIVLGFAGVFDRMGVHLANWAHAVGLVAGLFAACLPFGYGRSA